MIKQKCEVCGKEDFHVHKQEVITEFFLPDAHNLICHCGSVAVHEHKQQMVTHVHWGSDLIRKYLK